ncbi:MAG TPA: efflux RND transporter permease subunit, partial [Planctomycetota bacterium]|nr:efflux RND transporter permease subunit [Planctomycetota bacterium]
MNPIEASVRRPYTVAVAVVIAVVFSWIAYERLPVQLKPTVEEPKITVTTLYRGAGAIEVEEEVTRELEEVLQSVEGLVELTSESREGQSVVTLEFELGTDVQLAVVDVINKLSQVPNLPDEADEPAVAIADVGGEDRSMWIACRSGYDPNYTRRLVDEEIEARLERVPGVSDLFVVGGSEREIQVRLDPDLLVARGIPISQLAEALRAGNLNLRGGTVESVGRQFVLRTVGRALEAQELGELIVAETPSGSVRLGEIADVRDTYRETESFVKISGTPGVAMGVGRQTGANVVDMIEAIEVELERINAGFRDRGIDLRLEPVYRETTYITAALAFVRDNLVLGAVLATAVLLVFLRSWRSVLIVGLSIPISLAAVFLVLLVAGKSLNVISLAGLAFASGMVVDNAIVVLENVFRHLELGKGRLRAAIDGGREVWGGILASTLTTVAVFVPILIQEDEASQIFGDMAIAIAGAVALSLVVSLTVVPVLCSMLLGRREGVAVPDALRADASPPLGLAGRAYAALMDRLVSNRLGGAAFKLGVVLLIGAATLASLGLAPPAEYLPQGNRNLTIFFAAPVPGTRPESVDASFRQLEAWALAQPETERMFCVVAPIFNGGGVILKPEYSNAAGLDAFQQRMMGPGVSMPGFRFFFAQRMPLFADASSGFQVEVSGPDLAQLQAASDRLTGALRAVEGVAFVRPTLVSDKPEIEVVIDEARAKDLGLAVADVGAFVETLVAGRRLSRLIEGGREVEVNVVAPQARVSSTADLEQLRFLTDRGEVATLGSVASVERRLGVESVRRKERERSALIEVNLAPDAALESVIEAVLRDVFPPLAAELGPAYALDVAGSADKLRVTLDSLSAGFGLSVLIIYLLLVALFRSWFSPAIILVTVPLALTGGLLGILTAIDLSGGEVGFDVLAMLGFVILAGLVVNNAILIVHQANNFRLEGMDRRRALAESAKSRLRPILMTVITTVIGMAPLALGGGAGAELYQGLAAILVGGLLFSTLFTLFLVPVLISLGHDIADRLGVEDRLEP